MEISTSGTARAAVHLLVDFENLKPSSSDVELVRSEEYRLWVFHGPHQNKFDASLVRAWQPLGTRVDFVQSSKQGKNALDFHIAFKLGELIADQRKTGRRATYVVVSGDGGFEPLFDYMRTQGCTVRRVGSISDALAVPALEPLLAQASAAPPVSEAPKRPSRGIIPGLSQSAPASAPKKKAAAKAAATLRDSVVDGDVKTIVAELRTHPKNRPSDRAALERYIVARLGNKITSGAAKAIAGGLEQQKVVSFNGTKVAYKIPKAEK